MVSQRKLTIRKMDGRCLVSAPHYPSCTGDAKDSKSRRLADARCAILLLNTMMPGRDLLL